MYSENNNRSRYYIAVITAIAILFIIIVGAMSQTNSNSDAIENVNAVTTTKSTITLTTTMVETAESTTKTTTQITTKPTTKSTSTTATTTTTETTTATTINTTMVVEIKTVETETIELSISDEEYILLCNAVGHEAGSDSLSKEEKALVVEVIMNRVASPMYPNTIGEVIVQPGQFSGAESYAYLGEYSYQVTDLVKAGVDEYFQNRESYQHGYMSFYGDGYCNYFS